MNKRIIDYDMGARIKEFFTKKTITILVIIFAVLFVFIPSTFTTINSGEVGVRVRFGKAMNSPVSEGINIKIPFVEKIEKVNIKVQKIEVNTNSSSKDLQDVDMSIAVNYHINKESAIDLYKNVGMYYENVILEPAIEESIKAVTSKYTAEELITQRSEVSDKCMEELKKKVEKYGLVVNDFNLTNFNFSAEFEKAIEEKQVAEQKVLTAKQELEREKIEAEKKIVAAEAEKQANELKEKTLTDNIIKEKFIEKWNGELPKVTGEGTILNIDGLVR